MSSSVRTRDDEIVNIKRMVKEIGTRQQHKLEKLEKRVLIVKESLKILREVVACLDDIQDEQDEQDEQDDHDDQDDQDNQDEVQSHASVSADQEGREGREDRTRGSDGTPCTTNAIETNDDPSLPRFEQSVVDNVVAMHHTDEVFFLGQVVMTKTVGTDRWFYTKITRVHNRGRNGQVLYDVEHVDGEIETHVSRSRMEASDY